MAIKYHPEFEKLWLEIWTPTSNMPVVDESFKEIAFRAWSKRQPLLSDYAYPTIKDYENIVGFETNEAFRMGWTMARTTEEAIKNLTRGS